MKKLQITCTIFRISPPCGNYIATLPSCCVTASPFDVNTLQPFATVLPWSVQWSRRCCHQVAICLYHVATETSMRRQYVVSPITHMNFFRPFAMSWQRCGNVVATSGCHHVASKLPAKFLLV